MLKRLMQWLTKADRPPKPPLLEAGSKPPPPPPPRYSRVSEGSVAAQAQVPAPRRRFRLIKGDGEDAAKREHPSSDAPAEPDVSEPVVRLVFNDGTSERIAAGDPGGVRVRYLAENLLPPQD